MKKLIIAEVNTFRAEVRAQARAAGQIRRQDRSVGFFFCFMHASTLIRTYTPIAFLSLAVTKF